MGDFFKNISLGELQWVELFYAVFGSFIGIFVPLWIDKSRARKQEKEARNKLIASLDRELNSVKQLIEECNTPDGQYQIFSFSTFVWDSIIASGLLPEMLADKKIQGELLMEIYSDLSLLEELHTEFCQCENREDLLEIYNSVTEKRRQVYEKIGRYQSGNNKR